MNETELSPDGATPSSSGFRSRLKASIKRFIKMSRRRDNLDALYKLSDKELRDIGYERDMLPDVADQLFERSQR